MSYPIDLVLVRHGESEGNLAQTHARQGDESLWTEELAARHNSKYRLTDTGREQAQAAGKWIKENIATGFDRYYTSEFTRAMETAATLGFDDAKWMLEFYLREQDNGVLGGKSIQQRETQYADLLADRKKDSFYFCPPGGESMANACLRVNRVLSTLKDSCSGYKVLIVCHGNIMTGFRVRIEKISQSRYREDEASKSPATKIHNGQIIHYTRRDPKTGEVHANIKWVRSVCPWDLTRSSNEWQEIKRETWDTAKLLAEVSKVPQLVNNDMMPAKSPVEKHEGEKKEKKDEPSAGDFKYE